MAEQKDDIEIKTGKSTRTKLLIALIATILLGLIAFSVIYFVADSDVEETEQAAVTPKTSPIYHEISSPLIVNFSRQSDDQVRYLQIKVKVMAREKAVIDAVDLHEPAIVHELLMLFYSQNYDDLNTSEGTLALQQATLNTINDLLLQEAKISNGLEAVYFTSLVMQ